jgi:hypothetical protein
MRRMQYSRAALGTLALVLSGCLPSVVSPQPSVLAGEWILAQNPELPDTTVKLTFDHAGRLDRVQAQVDAKMATYSRFESEARVVGDAVSITAPFYNNWFVFDGTLSPDQNRIDGVASLTLSLDGGRTVVLDDRPATLLRTSTDELADAFGAGDSRVTSPDGSPPYASDTTSI